MEFASVSLGAQRRAPPGISAYTSAERQTKRDWSILINLLDLFYGAKSCGGRDNYMVYHVSTLPVHGGGTTVAGFSGAQTHLNQ